MKRNVLTLLILLAMPTARAQLCFDAKQIGGIGDDAGFSISLDGSGNIYLTGPFTGTVDFDPGSGVENHVSNGNWDIFLCKFDASGHFLWARTWGGSNNDRGSCVAVDKLNNVYVVGPFQGTVDFDPGAGSDIHTSNAGTMNNPFVSKFDCNGNFKWARTWGTVNGGSEAYSCTVDQSGYVYVVGDFSELNGIAVDFDPGNSVDDHYCNGLFDAWISKFDSLGNFIWARTWGGDSYDDGPSVETDDGGIYDGGMFMSLNCDFDPGPGTDIHSSNGDIDAFVSKFDFEGNHLWTRTWGAAGQDDAGKVISDYSGNLFIVGYYANTVDFDPGSGVYNMTSAGGIADIFLSKFDTAGNFTWAESMGGTGEDKSFSVTRDGKGNLYLSGIFTETADFDPGTGTYNLTSAGGYDIFICKLDTAGNLIWANRMGGTDDDKGISCLIDTIENLYVTGSFKGTADFDPEGGIFNMTSFGGTDVFIDKIFDCAVNTENKSDIGSGLSVFPNPANDIVNIRISSPQQNYSIVTIYDIRGKLLDKLIMKSSRMQMDLSDIPAGIYILKVITGKSVATVKLIRSQ
jgi:hypothetical protein